MCSPHNTSERGCEHTAVKQADQNQHTDGDKQSGCESNVCVCVYVRACVCGGANSCDPEKNVMTVNWDLSKTRGIQFFRNDILNIRTFQINLTIIQFDYPVLKMI